METFFYSCRQAILTDRKVSGESTGFAMVTALPLSPLARVLRQDEEMALHLMDAGRGPGDAVSFFLLSHRAYVARRYGRAVLSLRLDPAVVKHPGPPAERRLDLQLDLGRRELRLDFDPVQKRACTAFLTMSGSVS